MALLMTSGLVGYAARCVPVHRRARSGIHQFAVETALVVVAAAVLPRYGPPPALAMNRYGATRSWRSQRRRRLVLLLGMLALPPTRPWRTGSAPPACPGARS